MKNETTIQKIHRLLRNYFVFPSKVEAWMNINNPLLGCRKPIEMIKEGREEKLLKFIEDMLEDNNL